MESNLISVDGDTDMKQSDLEFFDIYLCGIHEVLKYKSLGDMNNIMFKNYTAYKFGKKPSQKVIDNTTKAYINAVKNNPIDILVHINYKCFCNLVEVAKACADYGTYIEINTKKRHISAEELNAMAQTGARFVIDSDAHDLGRVGDTKLARDLLDEANIPLSQIDNIDGRLPKFRFAEYKLHH
jgi:putative hydrolase